MILGPDNEYRFVTIIGALQVVGVLLAWFPGTALVKVWGMGEAMSDAQFPKGAILMRDHGWALLSLPLTWITFASVSKRRDSPTWEGPLALILGFIVLGGLLFFAVAMAVMMFAQPI